MKKIMQFISLVLMCILQGCSGQEPTRKEIMGVWTSENGAELKLNEDGTFSGSKLPTHLLWLPEYKGQLLRGDGIWKVQKNQGTWEVYLAFDQTDIESLSGGFGTKVNISGSGLLENKPPWYLFLWIGEEGGDRYKFKKK